MEARRIISWKATSDGERKRQKEWDSIWILETKAWGEGYKDINYGTSDMQ